MEEKREARLHGSVRRSASEVAKGTGNDVEGKTRSVTMNSRVLDLFSSSLFRELVFESVPMTELYPVSPHLREPAAEDLIFIHAPAIRQFFAVLSGL